MKIAKGLGEQILDGSHEYNSSNVLGGGSKKNLTNNAGSVT